MSQLSLLSESSPSIKALNKNLRTLEFWVRKYELDKIELDALYADLAMCRKFKDNVGLGNTSGTYTGWLHVAAMEGYSLWKYAVTNFADDVSNILYMQNLIGSENLAIPQLFEYQGAADSELESYFAYLYLYSGSTFSTNFGGAAGTLSIDGGDYETILSATADFFYVGDSAVFTGISFEHRTKGAGSTYKLEYWNGSAWTQLTVANSLTDTTINGISDGKITFAAPADWATSTVNSQSAYWIRLSTTTTPSRLPVCYQVAPTDSVYSLLIRSSQQVFAKEWAWCYYNGYVYTTLPNAGSAYYEGSAFIASSSSAANKLTFFVYNNVFYTRYKDSTWPVTITGRGGASTFAGETGVVLTHSIGHTNYHVDVTPTANPGGIERADFKIWTINAANTTTIYCSSGVTSAFTYRISVF